MISKHSKLSELREEFRNVVTGRRSWGDALVPPLVFVLINLAFGIWPAIAAALGVALLTTVIRLIRKQTFRYALGGLGGAVAASLLAIGLSRGEGYFLPGMIRGGGMALLCLFSVLVRRPLVAWTSFIARRWPMGWYWHPKVRPAYSEVTLLWFLFFGGRFVLQYLLFQRGATLALSSTSLVLGWPAIALLLIGTYLYGIWRLRHLGGPSVQEYRDDLPPPWEGQAKGF